MVGIEVSGSREEAEEYFANGGEGFAMYGSDAMSAKGCKVSGSTVAFVLIEAIGGVLCMHV